MREKSMGPQQPVLPEQDSHGPHRSRQMVPGDRARPCRRIQAAPGESAPGGPSPGAGGPAQHRTGQRHTTNNPDNNITARTLEEGPGWR